MNAKITTPHTDIQASRPRRSALYMPGANARALEKARTLDADCLLLDLEDAVAPDM
jgi:citrate lyase subunit beta/citryl-CoA lyase